MKYRFSIFKKRIMLTAFLFAFTLLTNTLRAQNGQFGYDLAASSGTFTSIAGTAGSTRLNVLENNEAISGPIDIGFPFHYYGQAYTQLKASSNGFITFDTNLNFSVPVNSLYIAHPVIAPLWDDMNGNVGQSTYLISGVAPNRIFTMEWLNWKWGSFASAPGISFQVKLYEGANKIEFIYQQEAGALKFPGATIGITGGNNNLYSLGDVTSQPNLRPGGYNGISSKPANGQVYSFNPRTTDFTTPTLQATNVTAVPQGNKTVINWTNGNGQYRAVFIKEAIGGGDLILTNNTHYEGTSTVGVGPNVNGWYCVFNGVGGGEAYITKLSDTKRYKIQIVEYTGQGKLQKYNTSVSTNNPIEIGPKENQTVTFPLIAPKKIDDAPFTLSASASSGLLIQFTSSDTSIVTISGNTATIVGVGTAQITASQAGNENYNAANPVTQALVVNKADQTITFPNPGDKNADDPSFSLGATSTSALPITYSTTTPEQIFISGNYALLTGVVGTAKIIAQQSGNAQYNAAPPVEVTFFIKAVPVISWYNANWLQTNTTSGNQWYKDGVLIPGATSKYLAASPGSYTVQVTSGGYVSGFSSPLVVTENNQTITFPELPYLKIGASMDLDTIVTASSGLPVTYACNPSIAIINGSIVTAVAEGIVQIMASQPGNEQYNPADYVYQFLTVSNRIPQTITFDLQEEAFVNDGPITLTATASSGLPVSFETMDEFVAKVSGNTLTLLRTGMVIIIAKQEGDSLYNTAQQQMRLLSVKKSNQTISFPTLALKTIGDAPFSLNASASSGLPVKFTSSNTSVVTISGDTATIVGTGTVTITASQAGNTKYNAAVSITNVLTVDKLSQTITFTPLNEAVSGTPLELIATASSGLPVSFGVTTSIPDSLVIATISGNTLIPTAAGTVQVVAFQPGNNQYKGSSTFQTLTIVNGGISGSASHSDLEVYPNTVRDVLLVDVSDDAATTLSLYNNMGALITQQSGQKMIEVDMRQYPSGRYMLVIQSEGRTISRHIIKE